MLKLTIDHSIVTECNRLSEKISGEAFNTINTYTTTGVERAILRLMGVSGATKDELKIPLVNILTDLINERKLLANGIAPYLIYLNNYFQVTANVWIEQVYSNEIELPNLDTVDAIVLKQDILDLAATELLKVREQRQKRERYIQRFGERPTPWKYVIVATGNIYEDLEQAEIAVRQGADIIAVIRSTAQSLLDFVPEGATSEGIAGTYATQENFRLMRHRLDELGKKLGRYIRLTNYASGLCMAEMAALGAIERLDMMLSDSMYGILFRDINMIRTFIDQHFARRIQAYAGIIINTGEDNYLTTTEQYEAMHVVLASQFINRKFAHLSNLPDNQIGLGHAFEMDPTIENGFLLSLADALLSRECFPDCPLKYMPPTRHIDGNIFFAHVVNSLFNLTSIASKQHIHLVGILSEAIHTPFVHERFLALQNADYIFNYAKDFFNEFHLLKDGIIEKRANDVLSETQQLLKKIDEVGLLKYFEHGGFANVKRDIKGGKGYEGVIKKTGIYFNPFDELLA